MKRIVFIIPIITTSLLVSCGGSKEPTKVTYTLTYTYDNGTDDKYVETYDKNTKTVRPTWEPTYPGYTFDDWYTESGKESSLFTFGNTLTADTVIFAQWVKNPAPKTHTITFKNRGDEVKKIEDIEDGSIIPEDILPIPSPREGFSFIGWCTDTKSKNVFDFKNIKIYQDYTLYFILVGNPLYR